MTSDGIRWLAESFRFGTRIARVGVQDGRVVAEWIGILRLTANRDGTDPVFAPAIGADQLQLAKIERGAARVLLRTLKGGLGFHGSAVAIEGRSLLLLGDSGTGKSTLAAAMAQRGAFLLSDDAIGVEHDVGEWNALPVERASFLDDSAISALAVTATSHRIPSWKLPVVPPKVGAEKAKICALIGLRFADSKQEAMTLRTLSGADALAMVVAQVMRFVLDEPNKQREELDRLVDLVTSVPVFELTQRKEYDSLPVVCDFLTRKFLLPS